jgi:hypothetical protein
MDELVFNIAGASARLRAPSDLMGVVDRMLANVSRNPAGQDRPLHVDARFESNVWYVGGVSPQSMKVFEQGSPLPQVAGGVIASLVAEVAHHQEMSVWRAAVLEKGGDALVLGGDDWESCITLAAHLHTRGWRFVSCDYALVRPPDLNAVRFEKSLHANSSCISSFPRSYRRAVEESPWYSTSDQIAFYAIDPTIVDSETPWADEARICGFLKVDGHVADHASIEPSDDFQLGAHLRRQDLLRAGIAVGTLVRSGFSETCDFIEHWFSALPSRS